MNTAASSTNATLDREPTFIQAPLPLIRHHGERIACLVGRITLLTGGNTRKTIPRRVIALEMGVTEDTVSEWVRRAQELSLIVSRRTGDASEFEVLYNPRDDIAGPSGPPYIQVPLSLIRQAGFPLACLVARLRLYGRQTGRINPAAETLARELGIGRRQVENRLRQAKQLGLISWKRTKRTSFYTVLWTENITRRQTAKVLDISGYGFDSAEISGQRRGQFHIRSEKDCTQKDDYENNTVSVSQASNREYSDSNLASHNLAAGLWPETRNLIEVTLDRRFAEREWSKIVDELKEMAPLLGDIDVQRMFRTAVKYAPERPYSVKWFKSTLRMKLQEASQGSLPPSASVPLMSLTQFDEMTEALECATG